MSDYSKANYALDTKANNNLHWRVWKSSFFDRKLGKQSYK